MLVPLSEIASDEVCHRSRHVWSVRTLKTCERLEILCALLGTKRIVRLVADDDTAQEYTALAWAMGLKSKPSRVRQAPVRSVGGDVYTQTVPWDDTRGQWFSFFLGQDDTLIEEAICLETKGVDSETFGCLLGYPNCCVRLYCSLQEGGDWLEVVLDQSPSDAVAFALSNPLARLFSDHGFLPDFFPCSLVCPHALRLAQNSREALLHLGYGETAESILCELRKTIFRVGRRSLVQVGAASRLQGCLQFDPTNVRTYGPLSLELRDLFRCGKVPLVEDGHIDFRGIAGLAGQTASLMEFTD